MREQGRKGNIEKQGDIRKEGKREMKEETGEIFSVVPKLIPFLSHL